MQRTLLIAAVGLAFGLTACSKTERQDTANDVQAAADRVGEEARQAAASPEVKKVGAEIKDAAGDVAQVAKDTAKGAAQGARAGAAKVEAEEDHPAKADDSRAGN